MKKKIIYMLPLFIMLIGSLFNTVMAQDIGKTDSLYSSILKEKRFINILFPKNYKAGNKYDVLYVLDGGVWNTGMIAQIQQFVEAEKYMVPTIIISVQNVDRNRDFTPTHIDNIKTSGGAEKFLGFIKNELLPYVDKTYPSSGNSTLWGHSFGGLFAVYALLNEPQIFKSYIAVDPSLWWDNCYIQKIAPAKLQAQANLNATLFMGGREGQDGRTMKIDTMDVILKKIAPAGLTWKTINYPDETHSSVRLKTTFDALKFQYGGYNSRTDFHPMNGIILKDNPIRIWFFRDTTKVYYTLDGTAPTTLSPKMKPELMLDKAAKLTNKHFAVRSQYDQTTTGNFVIGKTFASVSKPENAKPGGFNYSYYEGEWDEWPDFKNLKNPIKTGLIDKDFDIGKLPRKKNFALAIDGLLQTKEDGYHILILETDKAARLYLDGRLLMNWNGSNDQPCSYILPLAKGFHSFRLEYFQKNEGSKLNLSYLTPSIMDTKKPIPIPLDAQYSQNP